MVFVAHKSGVRAGAHRVPLPADVDDDCGARFRFQSRCDRDRAAAILRRRRASASAGAERPCVRDAQCNKCGIHQAGPILAPAASLAGDAQTLSTALGAHDNAAASVAMAAVLSDRDKIEAAAKIAGGQYPEQWTFIREKIAALEKQVPASKGSGSIARSDASAPSCAGLAAAGRRKDAGRAEDCDRIAGLPGRNRASERLPGRHRSQVGWNLRRRHEEQRYRRRQCARRAATQLRVLDRAAFPDRSRFA